MIGLSCNRGSVGRWVAVWINYCLRMLQNKLFVQCGCDALLEMDSEEESSAEEERLTAEEEQIRLVHEIEPLSQVMEMATNSRCLKTPRRTAFC